MASEEIRKKCDEIKERLARQRKEAVEQARREILAQITAEEERLAAMIEKVMRETFDRIKGVNGGD